MTLSGILFVASAVTIGIALLLGLTTSTGFMFVLIAFVTFSVALLRRPRERAAARAASFARAIDEAPSIWGEGVGPVPGDVGPVTRLAELPPVLLRAYKGRSMAEIEALRVADAALLAKRGYFPTSEAYRQGQWRPIDWLAAILFFTVALGLLVAVYMIVVRPAGTLTVTYQRRADASNPPGAVSPDSSSRAAATRLAELTELRDRGLITAEEWESRRRSVIAEI